MAYGISSLSCFDPFPAGDPLDLAVRPAGSIAGNEFVLAYRPTRGQRDIAGHFESLACRDPCFSRDDPLFRLAAACPFDRPPSDPVETQGRAAFRECQWLPKDLRRVPDRECVDHSVLVVGLRDGLHNNSRYIFRFRHRTRPRGVPVLGEDALTYVRRDRPNADTGIACLRPLVFPAVRISLDDLDRSTRSSLWALAKTFFQAKIDVRHLADGVYLSDSRACFADTVSRSAKVALSVGCRNIRAGCGVCHLLASIPENRSARFRRLFHLLSRDRCGESGFFRDRGDF